MPKELTLTEIADIAMTCHEANRVYCSIIGEDSQVFWFTAPGWQKDSAINGVKFHIDNPEATASQSHDNWLAEKLADGWVYGPVKDAVKKTHPCCVPYNQLPVEQRRKDYLFKAIVRALTSGVESE